MFIARTMSRSRHVAITQCVVAISGGRSNTESRQCTLPSTVAAARVEGAFDRTHARESQPFTGRYKHRMTRGGIY